MKYTLIDKKHFRYDIIFPELQNKEEVTDIGLKYSTAKISFPTIFKIKTLEHSFNMNGDYKQNIKITCQILGFGISLIIKE